MTPPWGELPSTYPSFPRANRGGRRAPRLGCFGDDVELVEEAKERPRERRRCGARAHCVPIDLFAQRPCVHEQRGVVEVVLGEREELADDQVVDRHDEHAYRRDAHLVTAREELVVDGGAVRREQQVDEDVAVPGLCQPALRRPFGAHAGRGEGVEGGVDVALTDEEVDVVFGRRAPACPRGEPPAQRELDAGVAQCGRTVLERFEDLGRLRGGCRQRLACGLAGVTAASSHRSSTYTRYDSRITGSATLRTRTPPGVTPFSAPPWAWPWMTR